MEAARHRSPPTISNWETDKDHWAPDVILRASVPSASGGNHNGKLIVDKSSGRRKVCNVLLRRRQIEHRAPLRRHSRCRQANGAVRTKQDASVVSPRPRWRSIDPAGFKDKDGSQYVVFKVDGNTIGHGGICNNGIEPLIPTPILPQKVAKDGVRPIGDAVQILDRNTADNDGPLVEAPNLILHGDTYFLFYSTHYFFDPKYDVRWATVSSITSPYNKRMSRW
ncbi:Glycoside hydrolase [Penicillium brevicompactum]|uniref:uncharacterized protein n=1 Tax=Penicillium brevicompactum TaxID=5074 RepID=UPI00254006F6|nr:uncharacterized protein N7506_005481 [Penicillium brevicompactum]KAJ5337459.1 hypothetical protein N7506_005481 [Penicillium brevicompactum]